MLNKAWAQSPVFGDHLIDVKAVRQAQGGMQLRCTLLNAVRRAMAARLAKPFGRHWGDARSSAINVRVSEMWFSKASFNGVRVQLVHSFTMKPHSDG